MTITNLVLKVQIILERQANTGGIATLDYLCWKRKKDTGSFMPIFICTCLSEQGLAGSSLLDAGSKSAGVGSLHVAPQSPSLK